MKIAIYSVYLNIQIPFFDTVLKIILNWPSGKTRPLADYPLTGSKNTIILNVFPINFNFLKDE